MTNISRFTIKWTKYLVLSFGLVIFLFMVVSELFQVPHNPNRSLAGFENPVKQSILDRLSSFTLTNSLGTYQLAKMEDLWRLVKPRNLEARVELVQQIIQSLRNLKVRRIYDKDSINLQNFSLNRPTIEIELAAFNQTQKLKIGLLNSIDDSTYIIDDRSHLIYQVDLFQVDMQSLSLGDFINSNIFKQPIDRIQKLQVKKYQGRRSATRLSFMRKDQRWVDRRGRVLDQAKTGDLIQQLMTRRAEIILDQRSEALEKRVAEIVKRPLFAISVEQAKAGAEVTTYRVSAPLASLPDIKIEKRKFVLVTSSQKEPPLLVDKSILSLLDTRPNKLAAARKR